MAEVKYVIEGIVTEISSNGNFKIAGSEGYAIKQGDKKYNVLCSKEMTMNGQAKIGIILSQDFLFKTDSKNGLIYHTLGKRVKLSVSFKENDNDKKISEMESLVQAKLNSVIPITLFAN